MSAVGAEEQPSEGIGLGLLCFRGHKSPPFPDVVGPKRQPCCAGDLHVLELYSCHGNVRPSDEFFFFRLKHLINISNLLSKGGKRKKIGGQFNKVVGKLQPKSIVVPNKILNGLCFC